MIQMKDENDGDVIVSAGRVEDADRHVGKRLRSKRLMLGLSQQKLGDAVGVSIQQIQKYEKATNRIASGKLYQFAKLLNEPIAYFYEGLDALTNKTKTSMAESQDDFLDKDTVNEREIMALVRSYSEISDIAVRKKILDLVKTLSV